MKIHPAFYQLPVNEKIELYTQVEECCLEKREEIKKEVEVEKINNQLAEIHLQLCFQIACSTILLIIFLSKI